MAKLKKPPLSSLTSEEREIRLFDINKSVYDFWRTSARPSKAMTFKTLQQAIYKLYKGQVKQYNGKKTVRPRKAVQRLDAE